MCIKSDKTKYTSTIIDEKEISSAIQNCHNDFDLIDRVGKKDVLEKEMGEKKSI